MENENENQTPQTGEVSVVSLIKGHITVMTDARNTAFGGVTKAPKKTDPNRATWDTFQEALSDARNLLKQAGEGDTSDEDLTKILDSLKTKGTDLVTLPGTGKSGKVTKKDAAAWLKERQAAKETTKAGEAGTRVVRAEDARGYTKTQMTERNKSREAGTPVNPRMIGTRAFYLAQEKPMTDKQLEASIKKHKKDGYSTYPVSRKVGHFLYVYQKEQKDTAE